MAAGWADVLISGYGGLGVWGWGNRLSEYRVCLWVGKAVGLFTGLVCGIGVNDLTACGSAGAFISNYLRGGVCAAGKMV